MSIVKGSGASTPLASSPGFPIERVSASTTLLPIFEPP
jgi:hypothetical protein